jgi:hypothetical protein
MTEHTTGPWRLHQWSKAAGNPGVYSRVTAVSNDLEDVDICRFDLFPDAGDAHEANARLIAAAPEMLAALKMVLQHGRIDDSESRMAQVAAAITKAEGF